MSQKDEFDLAEDDGVDEELEHQIDWEEELEKRYGGYNDDNDLSRKNRDMGSGFSKQKQVMEESSYYQRKKKNKKAIKIKGGFSK